MADCSQYTAHNKYLVFIIEHNAVKQTQYCQLLCYPNAGKSHTATELSTAEAKRQQNTILGTSGDRSSMPMVVLDSQRMISYWCSTVTLGLNGTIIQKTGST